MALNFKQCKECGGVFQSSGKDVCPRCVKELDEKFKKIKQYLYKHPDAGVVEVSEETEIEERVILDFLKEGRLELKTPDGSISCEKCGAPISSGRLCKKCSDSLANTLNSVLPKKQPEVATKDKSKLHIEIRRK
ncbi:MAG: MerR family transcriptional regulator [Christensenellaceae bacterium]|jgi:flagellar operon protein (TIGR03826 family)